MEESQAGSRVRGQGQCVWGLAVQPDGKRGGNSGFQAARSGVWGFHGGGCWGVLRLGSGRDGPGPEGDLGVRRVLGPKWAVIPKLRGQRIGGSGP